MIGKMKANWNSETNSEKDLRTRGNGAINLRQMWTPRLSINLLIIEQFIVKYLFEKKENFNNYFNNRRFSLSTYKYYLSIAVLPMVSLQKLCLDYFLLKIDYLKNLYLLIYEFTKSIVVVLWQLFTHLW